jgi:hypothetical protein
MFMQPPLLSWKSNKNLAAFLAWKSNKNLAAFLERAPLRERLNNVAFHENTLTCKQKMGQGR